MQVWDEIRAWRVATRASLIARRRAVTRPEKVRSAAAIHDAIAAQFPELRRSCIGFYWPIKGEIDLRHLVQHFLALGADVALPVVVAKQRPLEFWAWRPGMTMGRGIWNIPIPGEPKTVQPTALLVPLVGFDAAGYRLGYGGGYYDRTLAAMGPRPLTIGVGQELGRLDTIHPQPHDIPLDAIVTEAGFTRFTHRGQSPAAVGPVSTMEKKLDEALKGTFPASDPVSSLSPTDDTDHGGTYASPPCFMHELRKEYHEHLGHAETVALLNLLLEGERAGARAVAAIARAQEGISVSVAFQAIARDEARFCAMLSRHIARLGGTPSPRTSDFFGKITALDEMEAQVHLLNRGQGWVVCKLREALPRVSDEALHYDLKEMLGVHEQNIRRCSTL